MLAYCIYVCLIIHNPFSFVQDPSDMVDVGVVQEVVRHAICMSNTTINVSQWIGRSEEEGIPIQRTMSHESRSTDVAGSVPSSPRPVPTQKSQHVPEVFEAKEVSQQQHQQQSAVRILCCYNCT